jgi:hypothetical protein
MAQKLLQALREQAPRKTGLTFCLTYVKRGSEYFFSASKRFILWKELEICLGEPGFFAS